ncbi:L,D-transpeptidase family protein [Trichlorobacter thiogenes]|uniref:L,D-transpeptidase family protein n=1 Tax=Trichlorobacter thiogenes TaxID=115783 RepID=UPI00099A5BE3|nr:L,D-transpeptidase family protein [Trichlorobacter thiogenes]
MRVNPAHILKYGCICYLLLLLIGCTPAPLTAQQPQKPRQQPTAIADRVVVEKSKHQLHLQSRGQIIRSYQIALGPNPQGHKQRESDGRTPEGIYRIDYRNPRSAYHRSLHISYPASADRQRAAAVGDNPGSDIMIHGLGTSFAAIGKLHTAKDWTLGCIAVTNDEIEEIWKLVPNGTIIEIKP